MTFLSHLNIKLKATAHVALNGQLYSTQKRIMSGVKRTVKDYSESTTIHGISYIFESGLSALERFGNTGCGIIKWGIQN